MPVAPPYDPYAITNPWWQQQRQQPAPPQQFGQPSSSEQQKQPPKQPSLYDMMLNLGRMSRPQYDKAIQGPGAYGMSPGTAGAAGPWAFLGSLGLPGGGGGR